MSRLLHSLIVLSFTLGTNVLAAQSKSTYGDIYVVEQKERQRHSWEFGLTGQSEVSNSYQDIFGVSLSIDKTIGSFASVGIQWSKHAANANSVTTSVQRNLETDGITQSIRRPDQSLFGVGTIYPLAGKLNFFNSSAVNFDLGLRLGAGIYTFENADNEFAVLWGIQPRAFITENIGVFIGLDQNIERLFLANTVVRTQGLLGVKLGI